MLMKKLPAAVLVSMLMAQAALAADVVVNVNGQPIKRSWLDAVKKEVQDAGRTTNDNTVANLLVRTELLAQEAQRMGIDRTPDFQIKEEMRRRELLSNMMVAEYQKRNPVTESMIRAEYDRQVKALGTREFSLRHILVKSEAEARDVMKELSGKKADFAKIASRVSKDDKTSSKGGDTGWIVESGLRGELRDAVSKLKKGEHTKPVQSKNGWHIVKMEKERVYTPPKLDDPMRARLANSVRRNQVDQLVRDLRARAKVEVVK